MPDTTELAEPCANCRTVHYRLYHNARNEEIHAFSCECQRGSLAGTRELALHLWNKRAGNLEEARSAAHWAREHGAK
jgi:hypothetical protein